MNKFNSGKFSISAAVLVFLLTIVLIGKNMGTVAARPDHTSTPSPTPTATPHEEDHEDEDEDEDDEDNNDEQATSKPSASPRPTEQPVATPNPDLCANLDGIQYEVPQGLHIDASKVNLCSFWTTRARIA